MSTAWSRAFAWIRRAEGGYVDHPQDPGGATYAGISLRAVVALDRNRDGALDFDLDHDGDVDADDIRMLRSNPDLVEGHYREAYWYPSKASEMPWPLALFHFDAAVHSGVQGATLLLQRGLGDLQPDGLPGPRTLKAAKASSPWTMRRVLAERADFLSRLSQRRSNTFLRGWLQRLFDLHAEGLTPW